LIRKRNEAAHGGNVLGDYYVIQAELESNPMEADVLKVGFENMYQLGHDRTPPDISQKIQHFLDIWVNVKILDEWNPNSERASPEKKAVKARLLNRIECIRWSWISCLSWLEKDESDSVLRKIEEECQDFMRKYNRGDYESICAVPDRRTSSNS
jgi:hypothetical protein